MMIQIWIFLNSDLMFWTMLAIAGAILVILIIGLYPERKDDDLDLTDENELPPKKQLK